MQEIVFQAADRAAMLTEAKRLGFTENDANGRPQFVVNGELPDGGAYFFNEVGTVYEPVPPGDYGPDNPPPAPVARPGYWARARVNGIVEEMPEFSETIRRYAYSSKVNRWVDVDTREFAPDWIGDIGVIA